MITKEELDNLYFFRSDCDCWDCKAKDKKVRQGRRRAAAAYSLLEEHGFDFNNVYISGANEWTLVIDGKKVKYFPRRDWFSGKGVGSGKGLVNLLAMVDVV